MADSDSCHARLRAEPAELSAVLQRALAERRAVAEIIRNATSGEAPPTPLWTNLPNAEALAVRHRARRRPASVPGDPPWPLNRVLATVRNEVGDGARPPSVEAAGIGTVGRALLVVPADAFATLPSGPLQAGEDLLVPPTFLIVVRSPRWPLADDRAEPQGCAQTADRSRSRSYSPERSSSPPSRF